jgi:hypothetical protein
VSPFRSGLLNLVIVYENVTKENQEPLSRLDQTFIQIGNLTIPRSNRWMFCVSGINHHDCFITGTSNVKSLIVNVPSIGNYSMTGFSDSSDGIFETLNGNSILSVERNQSFIPECHFVPFATIFPATASLGATATARQTSIAIDVDDAGGMSGGVIAAVVMGLVVFLIVLIVGGLFVWKRFNPKRLCHNNGSQQLLQMSSTFT